MADNPNYCRRSRHSFNPVPGQNNSTLVYQCPTCQAETHSNDPLGWYNHTQQCPGMSPDDLANLLRECGL